MKTNKMLIKRAILLFKKHKFLQFSAKNYHKLNFLQIVLKIHPTEQEKVFKNWAISVLLLEQYIKHRKFEFLFYLWLVRKVDNYVFSVHFFWKFGWNYCTEIEILWIISKKFKKLTEKYHSESVKNHLCSALFQMNSALYNSELAVFQRT